MIKTNERLMNDFKAPKWLRSAHGQSCFGTIFKYRATAPYVSISFRLSDGDFLELVRSYYKDNNKIKLKPRPRLLLLHGIVGSFHSSYIQRIFDDAYNAGFDVWVMHYRGCGQQINLSSKGYNAGDWHDLSEVIDYINNQDVNSPLYVVGFSLGGSILLNYLTQNSTNPLTATAVVSSPLDLMVSVEHLPWIYNKYIISHLKKYVKKKCDVGYKFPLPWHKIERLKSIKQFDDAITAPMAGFKNAQAYFRWASCLHRLHEVQKDTLLVVAQDDPFIPLSTLPSKNHRISSSLQVELPKKGGHVGFINGMPWSPKFWLSQRLLKWFQNDH